MKTSWNRTCFLSLLLYCSYESLALTSNVEGEPCRAGTELRACSKRWRNKEYKSSVVIFWEMTWRGEDVLSLCHAASHVAPVYFSHNFQQVNYNLARFVEDVHVNRGAQWLCLSKLQSQGIVLLLFILKSKEFKFLDWFSAVTLTEPKPHHSPRSHFRCLRTCSHTVMASIPVLVFSIEKKNAFALPPHLSKFFILQSLSWTKEFAHGYLQEVLHLTVCVNVMLMVFVDFMQKNPHTSCNFIFRHLERQN